jgi:glycerol-3-phosphate dehydrogenase
MNRDEMIERLAGARPPWDVVVIGGGATGLGCAVDAALRGYRTALVERGDFGCGTSSRSTKLIHGGVRYLRRGNVRLVVESLRERWRLRRNAPHVVRDLRFVVPVYRRGEGAYYGLGLLLYDALAGRHGLGRSCRLTREATAALLPTARRAGLRGGVLYHDAQFDDARLALDLAATAAGLGAVVVNYVEVEGLERSGRSVCGVSARDRETGEALHVMGRVVVNAAGVGADGVRRMDDPDAGATIRPSRGSHVVLDRSFLPGDAALVVPRTDDGRVLFAIPWHGRTLVGTTEVPVDDVDAEPVPSSREIDFLLEHSGRYLEKTPGRRDVRSAFAGLRPLFGADPSAHTASIARDHKVTASGSGLVTIAGGKWTTYRNMAQDGIDRAVSIAGLSPAPCTTHAHPIHGHDGAVEREVEYLVADSPELGEPVGDGLEASVARVVWAARHEMARTVDDVLARRTPALFLDARAALVAAPRVAEILARELGRDEGWKRCQVEHFAAIVARHVCA